MTITMRSVILSFTLLVSVSIGSHAQNFSITPTSNLIQDTVPIDGQDSYYFDIENLLNEELELSWDLLEINFPHEWDYNLCDYLDCMLAPIPFHRDMEPIPALQSDGVYMKLWISPQNTAGYGEWVFHVYETGDLNTGDTITYQITAMGVSSVVEASLSEFKISPNPATDVVRIEVNEASIQNKTTVNLIDNLGRILISEEFTSNGTMVLDVSRIPMGLYSLMVQNKQQSAVKKLVLK